MKRKLILIMSDGGGASHLNGVHIDKQNYLNFFKSPYGGAWMDEEISVFDANNFFLYTLKYWIIIANDKPYDYFLIVYCGHGYTDENGDIRFQVCEDCDLKMDDLLAVVSNTRCLLIADSCRAIYRLNEGGRIRDTHLFSSGIPGSEDYSEVCREMYDGLINKTPSLMHTVLLACSFNEVADDGTTKGGLYSYNLLKVAKEYIHRQHPHFDNGEDYCLNVIECHNKARDVVIRESNNRQHPEIYKCCRFPSQFPFVVIPNWQKQNFDEGL